MRLALVTGAGGMIGRPLVQALAGSGYEVWAATRDGRSIQGAKAIKVDLRSPDPILPVQAMKFDLVVHLAGMAFAPAAEQAAVDYLDVFVLGTERLISALHGRPRFLLPASAAQIGIVQPGENPVSEDHAQFPVGAYGVAKAAQELVARRHSTNGAVELIIARLFNIVGPGSDPRLAVADWARQIARNERDGGAGVVCVGDLTTRRDFLDVRDVVRGLLILAELGLAPAAYNLCRGYSSQMGEMLGLLIKEARTPIRIKRTPGRGRSLEVKELFGENLHASELGWRPEIPLEESIKAMIAEARIELNNGGPV